jgi:hypothetical protein
MKNIKKYLIPIFVAVVGLSVWYFMGNQQFGGTTFSTDSPVYTVDQFRNYTFFSTSTAQTNFGTTTTATSTNITTWTDPNGRIDYGYFVIAGAKRLTFYFQRDAGTGANTGSTVFRVQATTVPSPVEADWFYLGDIVSATSTNAYTVAMFPLPATTTSQVSADIADKSLYAVRCIAVETTDGEHECQASADW